MLEHKKQLVQKQDRFGKPNQTTTTKAGSKGNFLKGKTRGRSHGSRRRSGGKKALIHT